MTVALMELAETRAELASQHATIPENQILIDATRYVNACKYWAAIVLLLSSQFVHCRHIFACGINAFADAFAWMQ